MQENSLIQNTQIQSNQPDYQAFLKKDFADYLMAQGTSKKTQENYISDIKSFILWFIDTLQSTDTPLPQSPIELVQFASTDLLYNYKHHLILDHAAVSTINRTLSSLRIFFRFCVAKGFIPDNPAEHIQNIPKIKAYFDMNTQQVSDMIEVYKKHLSNEKSETGISIDTHTVNILEFLQWLSKQDISNTTSSNSPSS